MCVVYGLSLLYIHNLTNELIALRDEKAEQTTKENAYQSLITLLDDTADERDTLASRFLLVDETALFVSAIEQDAQARGLLLTTTNLVRTEGEEEELDTLLVSFQVTGSAPMVKQFSTLLTYLPYHKRVSELRIYESVSEAWQGDITLHFSLIP